MQNVLTEYQHEGLANVSYKRTRCNNHGNESTALFNSLDIMTSGYFFSVIWWVPLIN